jgi:hypothetical protein
MAKHIESKMMIVQEINGIPFSEQPISFKKNMS